MAITRIKNNQITDSTITNAKIVPGTITGGSLNSNLSYSGNLTVTGNLSVSGTTTVVDTVNTTIADPLLVLSRNASGSASVDSGLIIERGDDTNVAFVWDESADEFAVATTTETGGTAGDITVSAYANIKISTAKVETLSDQAGTASPKIAGLSATRVTFGGTDGILTDDAGFTFASDTLTIGNVDIGTNTVETSAGNLTITGAGGGVTSGSDITFTASTASTSHTSGALIVTGGVGVGGNLYVNGAEVDISGNLTVDGEFDLTGNLSAGNLTLTGDIDASTGTIDTLDGTTATFTTGNITTVNSTTENVGTINVSTLANVQASTASTSTTTGAVIVAGGVGVGGNINVGGSDSTFTASTASTSNTTGAVVVTGGVGVGGNLHVGGATVDFDGNLAVGGDVVITGNLSVDGTATYVNTTTTTVKDPIFIIGGTDDGGAATTDDNLDRGIQFQWHNGSTAKSGFFGFDDSTGKFTFVPEATNTGEVISGTAGSVAFGDVSATTATFSGNVGTGNLTTNVAVITTGNITTINNVDANHSGNVYAQGNITAVTNLSGADLYISQTASVTGNLTAGNISTTTAVITTGNITTINSDDINAGNISVTTVANIADAHITDTTASTTTTTGALTVAGGTGIAGNINVGGAKSTFTDTTASTSTSSGVVVISGGVGIAGNAFVGNLAITGSTVISSTTNGPINFAPNGTGSIVLNSGGSNNDTVIKGETDDNLIYVDASADVVGIGTGTPHVDAKLHINSTDSFIIPNGTTAERPGSPAAAMQRFNSDTGAIEYYDGAQWISLSTQFTVIASQNFAGDGSTVAFTLNEAQTTASCIVSINGVIQLPSTAYSVSGTALTFTEAPGSTDAIEVRKLTTTSTVTNLADDVNGYTAIFSTPTGIDMYTGSSARTKYLTVDNNGQVRALATTNSTSLSTGALVVDGGAAVNGNIWVAGNVIPGTDEAYDLGTASNKWGSLYLAGSTITLGNIVIKDHEGAIAFYGSDGTTPAIVDSASGSTIIASGTSSVSVIASGGNIRANVGGSTVGVISSTGLVITGSIEATNGFVGLDATAITNGTSEVAVISSGGNIRANIAGSTVTTIYAGGLDITGNVDISQNLVVEGNLTVNGDTTTISATNLAVEDSFIYLNSGSTITNPDLGIAGNYNDGTYRHAGWFRDATDGKFKVFDQYTPEPGAEINIGHASYNAADFVAGALEATDTTASTSTTTGALKVAGGAGVAGNVYVGGTMYGTATSAQYADLAENYVGDAAIEPGTVVEFGGDAEVTACTHDMCTRVAGVVSTNPAYLMNNGLEAEHVIAVAFTGRVPCKVVGPVRKGDMMVSAGNGAARAEENPKVGSIIGKALENFDGAEGVIEVVVGRY